MIDLYKKQSEVVDASRFPLIILVIYGHMLGETMIKLKFDFTGNSIYIFISEMISHGLARVTVPAFFFFSGYFFFFKLKEWSLDFYLKQIKNRVYTLLIPYIIWNGLMCIAIIIKNKLFLLSGMSADELLNNVQHSSFYVLFWSTPVNFPLWYLRDLMCMSLITPFFYYLFKYLKFYGLLILFVMYVSGVEIKIVGFSTWAIWFFGLGSYLGYFKKIFLSYVLRYRSFVNCGALLLLFVSMSLIGTNFFYLTNSLFLILGIGLVLNVINYLHDKGKTHLFLKLSGSVFFIYAVHEIYIINWLKGFWFNSVMFSNIWLKIAGYFCIPFICLLICLTLYKLLNKICPNILLISVGGRVLKPVKEIFKN